jgi:hypothetical protein
MTDEKADQLAHRALEIDSQRLALDEKYYDLLKKVLPTVLMGPLFPARESDSTNCRAADCRELANYRGSIGQVTLDGLRTAWPVK